MVRVTASNPVPAAIDALLARLRVRAGLAGVQILDGPEAAWPENEFVAVGLSPEDLTVPSTRSPAGPGSTLQVGDIVCLARSGSGDTALGPRRRRVFALVDEVVAELDADPSLDGAVDHAEVTGSLYTPVLSKRNGVLADVVFTVQVRAF